MGDENGKIERWEDQIAELAVFGANVQPGQLVVSRATSGRSS